MDLNEPFNTPPQPAGDDEQLSAHARRIEELLADMPLAAPSSRLDDAVLGMPLQQRRRWRIVGLTSAVSGLAAGLAIAIGLWAVMQLGHGLNRDHDVVATAGGNGHRDQLASAATSALGIDEAAFETTVTNTDTRIVDEGVVINADRIPVHQIRRVTTHQLMYFNEKTNERLEVTMPQEEVIHIATEAF
jgi:hypothetical protein